MPGAILGTERFTSAEMAFLAKEQTIQIMPKIRLPELHFLNVRASHTLHPPPT